ncbi:SHOCT domain-containing protein [Oceanobacillus sojae]|nr:SHOCT domain-containing protein [Oceanobacillus sojae]MCT1905252.1 conjugal transfer protein [Oceanobacillus sojae]
MKKNLILYSMQISMLKQLLTHKLISEEEYKLVKSKLMKEFHIISDITG